MRKHIFNSIRSIVFLTILIISLYCINQTLTPKFILKNNIWPTTSSYYQFYKMKENSIDVIFLGSSVAVNAFSPQEIYNSYGIRSYNLGSEQQSIFLSYFWLKEALRFQSPQVVVLDTKFLFELHTQGQINTDEGMTRKCLDPMQWSSIKREAVSDLCKVDETQSKLSYYLTNIRFHTRWMSLAEYDMVDNEFQYSELKGYAPIAIYETAAYTPFISDDDMESRADFHELMQIYMDKTVDLCKENGITLVLVSLPGNFMNNAINNALVSYAEEKDVDYYNLCEVNKYNSIGATLPRENIVGHENLWGAIKMSQYMGRLFSDIYGVASITDTQYEDTKEYYEHIVKMCELIHITDMDEYLNAINDEHYTIFIAVRDDASMGLSDSSKEKLYTLGLRQDITEKYRWSYCAVVSPETGVSEQLTEKNPAVLSGSIRNKNTFYTMSSCGYLAGTTSSIMIDGIEYCKNLRGLNFVIYDNYLMKVVDQVAFDTCGESGSTR